MTWKDLLQTPDESIVSPWVGGRSLRAEERAWDIVGRLPPAHGWHTFRLSGRKAHWAARADAAPDKLRHILRGYLVGDRIVREDARLDPDPARIVEFSEPVLLLEDGLDRFVRIAVGRSHKGGPLIYSGPEMPLGPEDEVLQAFRANKTSVSDIKHVSPALDAAFRMESYQRAEAVRRRAELERLRKEEEERLAREERQRELLKTVGSAAGRRAVAEYDFEKAARAALQVGQSEYVDHRKSANKGEMIVTFKVNGRDFECVCHEKTLGIIDPGICLVNHATGEHTGLRFTLESLPSVIREAIAKHKLVVWRRVGDWHDDDREDWDD